MSLSLDKLQKLLSNYSMAPVRYYAYHDNLKAVEVMSLTNGEIFLVYVPSDYAFRMTSAHDGCYSLKRLELASDGTVPDKYAAKLSDVEMSEYYDKIDLLNQDKIMDKSIDVERELIDQYRRKILVPSSEENATAKVKDLLNQVDRLSKCVDTNDYGVAILSNTLLALDRDHLYLVRGREVKDSRMYVVVVGLETLFKNVNYITHDVPEINRGLQRILSKNHESHLSKLSTTIDSMSRCRSILQGHMDRVGRYTKFIEGFTEMIQRIKAREESIRDAVRAVQSKSGTVGGELASLTEKESLERELEWLQTTRGRIFEKLVDLHQKSRDISLTLDKLLFDNLVMMVTIQRNLSAVK